MARRTKRKVEKSLMVVDTKREIIDILQITNRRFMYNPQTGILILGDEAYGKSIAGSHAQEFYDSQAGGCFDDYLRGWIGTSKSYPRGVIHFAPAVIMEQFDRGFDALQMFARLEGTGGDTVIRGFCRLWEERIGALLSASLGGAARRRGRGSPAAGQFPVCTPPHPGGLSVILFPSFPLYAAGPHLLFYVFSFRFPRFIPRRRRLGFCRTQRSAAALDPPA